MTWFSLILAPLVFFAGVLWTYRPNLQQGFDEAACLALDEPQRSRCLRKALRGDGPHLDRLSS